ncbi:WD40 [Aspergillus sclerotialis]|uniref:GPI inositol-deacylase n=1 Tax=Aspergillus sclerotialis TaxID=2070753 RepID=A0A3A2ZEH3_9EURO|nr:WD40 [Aspergillus sclerotialis]
MSTKEARYGDSDLSSRAVSSTTVSTRSSTFDFGSSLFRKSTTGNDPGGDSKGSLGLSILYAPSFPIIDLVFVHGLGGGSRKTWSKSGSPADYWPQWLSKDPAFKNVRVHSFGYNSDWTKGKDNCLDIHHFAKSLIGELRTSPYITHDHTQIVLVGHSMGGLVIKKAYILARQDTLHVDLAKRFHSIYFLATPHRGSDSARLLNNILQITYSSRAYVADVKRGSKALQSINSEFRKYASDLDLWSFYETEKMSLGVFNVLIVDPDSATLGYPEEKQIPMNADHRSICKFTSPTDANYLIIRNALATTADGIRRLVRKSKDKLWREQINGISQYLKVPEGLENDLITAEDARAPGTCEWLLKKDSYTKWKDYAPGSPRVLWLNGTAASGKSVLAGYVVGNLRQTDSSCSYFFFKHGEKAKSELSTCLRVLAFQMACSDARIRESLLEMQKDGITFDYANERVIWRKLFLSGIFSKGLLNHYWVIDALDECRNPASFFDLMLAKLDESIPLRILIISRETSELRRWFLSLGVGQFQSETISPVDTLPDIELLVKMRANSFFVEDSKHRAALVDKILQRSNGSFLWTTLVLNELSTAYSEDEINQVVEDIPRGMEPLYKRTLESMSQSIRAKTLSKAILAWAACTVRPMKAEELEGALKLDIKSTFPKLEESIVALCGQLVVVDKFGAVQMVHETAREFLLNEDLESEFAIDKQQSHTRIAKACLIYLTGEEMKPPRTVRGSRAVIIGKRAEFSKYACTEFSYHLAKADPLCDDILSLLDRFLKCNILSWIEFIAHTKSLLPLIRTARHLRAYLNGCFTARSPLADNLQIIKGWATDLIRIAAKFADALIVSPSAIYSLILPFCPKNSFAFKTVRSGQRLSVMGVSNLHWDDRLTCIDFPRGQTTAVCHGDEFFAVGLRTGSVILYHSTACQEYKCFNHGEAVRFLQFKQKTDIMVSCGIKTIRLWDVHNGQLVYCFQTPRRPLGLEFYKNTLMVACDKNYLASWSLTDGTKQLDRPWGDYNQNPNDPPLHVPTVISISPGHQMLAAAYSGRPIVLWDLEQDTYYGSCGKKLPDGQTSTHIVTALIFNPNPSVEIIAASYLDGELILLDPFDDHVLASSRAHCHTLAASPDGRLLAGAAGSGTIHIYEFDTLRLMYQVESSNIHIKQLSFSKDGLHFLDIRGSQCNVWEPASLVRDLVSDSCSESTPTGSLTEAISTDTKVKITAMAVHHGGEVVFCGKNDGSVSLYDLKTTTQVRTLYRHRSSVRILSLFRQSEIIMSIDVSNAVHAWSLKKTEEGFVTDDLHFESRLESRRAIIQAFPSVISRQFILSTAESDHLWNLDGKEESRMYSNNSNTSQTSQPAHWVKHPQSASHVIRLDNTRARVYSWEHWTETTSALLPYFEAGILKTVTPFTEQKHYLLLGYSLNGSNALHFNVLDADMLNTPNVEEELHILLTFKSNVAHIIGIINSSRLLFIDTTSWVCSLDLNSQPEVAGYSYTRHFFLPYEWLAGKRDVICALVQRDVLIARNDEVAIIRGGLEYGEDVCAEI